MNIRLMGAMIIALCVTSIVGMEQEFVNTKQEQDSALIGGLPYRNGFQNCRTFGR